MLSHAGAKVVLLEDAAQAAKIASVREALPELEHVIVLTGEAEGAITLADLRGRGAEAGDAIARERVAAVDPEDTATIVYTSGTTGPPKGCVLSHANLLYTAGAYIDRLEHARQAADHLPVPAAGARARADGLLRRLDTGGTLAFWRGDTAKLAEDIGEAKPTHIPTVPRLLEKIHTRVVGTAAAAGGAKAAIFTRALATGEKVAKAKREGRLGRPARSRSATPSGDKLALSKVRNALGAEQPRADHRRGADRHRGDRVLLRLRRARARGLRDDRDVRGGDAEHVRARCRSGSVGRPLPGTEVLDRRGRRDPHARPARLQGLPPQRGGDRRDHRRRRLAALAATSARSSTATCASRAARRT